MRHDDVGTHFILTHNGEGLSTVYEACVRNLVFNYDLVLFTETFSADFPSHLFPVYNVFIWPGVRLTDSVVR